MAARENYYAESTGDSSTSSTSAQTKVTLNWTPGAASTDYLVIWSAQLNVEGTSSDVIVEFNDDGGTVRGQANHEPKDISDYHPVFGIWKYTSPGSPSAISFTLTYRSETGSTAHIREARIFVMRMGANDAYAALDSTDTETTTSFEVAANLTFTPPSIGDYLIIGSCEMAFSATTGESIHKLTHGGTDYGTATVRPQDATNFAAAGVVLKKSLAASSQSIDWNFARSATVAGTASCRNSRIAAIRLDAFADNYYGEVRASRSTSTSTTYANYATVTDTPLAARDHLIIGSCVRDHNSSSQSALTKLRTAGGDLVVNTLQEAVAASATIDVPAWAQMLRRTEAVSSTTWSVAYATETAGTSTGIDEGAIIVLDLEEVSVANKELAADAGSYALTGQTAGTLRGRMVGADAGSYALSGQTAALEFDRQVIALAGSYALTGQTANLEYDRTFQPLEAGSYALTGQDATLTKGLAVTAEAGSYALTGQTAALEHDKQIIAEAGSYALTGVAANLEYDRIFQPLDPGSYLLSGQDAALNKGLTLAAEAGSYAVTGQDATFLHNRAVIADAGSYDLSGQDAALLFDRQIEAGDGSYALSGQDATLTHGVDEFCPEGVTFDGTNDRLERGGNLNGIADGRQGSISVWSNFKAHALVGRILGSSHFRVLVFRRTDEKVSFSVGDGVSTFSVISSVTVPEDGNYHNILMSWDTNHGAGSKLWSLVIDDVPDTSAAVTDAAAAFDISYLTGNGDWRVGADASGLNRINADLARMWFSATEFLDFNNSVSDRRKFIDANGGAVWLGSNGSLPTGNQPVVYLEGPAADFHLNRGSGGDFTVVGALTDAATDPPCAGELFLAADAGSYLLTGQNAALEFDRQIIAESGSYALTGQNATLQYGKTLNADAGAYSLTGSAADLYFNRLIEANAGGYILTGQDATLTLGKFLAAEGGSYLMSGQDVDLIHVQNINPGAADIENTTAGAAISGAVAGGAVGAAVGGASISGSKPGAAIQGSAGGVTIQ